MSRTITYKGPAAGAFVRAQQGEKLETEQDKLERVATVIYGQVATGTQIGMNAAAYVLRQLLKHGLDKTAEELVGEKNVKVLEKRDPTKCAWPGKEPCNRKPLKGLTMCRKHQPIPARA